MPEIELDESQTAKTLSEHMADELAAERNKYDALLACDFVKTILGYSKEIAKRYKEQAVRSLDARDAARFEAWESIGNGSFFARALDWRFSTIRREYVTVQRILDIKAQGSRRKADRHGNALGEYGLYQSGGDHPPGDQ